jgi:serine/threonine protein kinase
MKVDVALKVLRPEIARNPEMLERFRKEIVLTRDLNHPNILPIYHLGELEGRKYLTMKWIDGGTLAEEIAERGPLEIGRILAITDKLASALQALHARGILHRDVKPHNVKMRELDERSDIYSLGLVVFEMATGRRAFDARSAEEVLRMHCTVPPPQTGDLRPDLPNRLSGLIARCLEKSPGARYPTAEEVRLALGAVQGGGS